MLQIGLKNEKQSALPDIPIASERAVPRPVRQKHSCVLNFFLMYYEEFAKPEERMSINCINHLINLSDNNIL